jgi:hypothetical protein
MPTPDPYKEQDLERLQMFVVLIPVLGFFPALWMLYQGQGSAQQRNASRLAVTLALGWVLSALLLSAGTQVTGDSLSSTLSLLILSSFLTSGYFLTNFWLMVRLWRRQSLRLPGVSQLSDRLP